MSSARLRRGVNTSVSVGYKAASHKRLRPVRSRFRGSPGKRSRPEGRPKSREETPKEGCNTDTQRSMLHCTIYGAVHNKTRAQAVYVRIAPMRLGHAAGRREAEFLSALQEPETYQPSFDLPFILHDGSAGEAVMSCFAGHSLRKLGGSDKKAACVRSFIAKAGYG